MCPGEVLSHQPNGVFPPPLLCELCCATEIRNLGFRRFGRFLQGSVRRNSTHNTDSQRRQHPAAAHGTQMVPLVVSEALHLLFSFFWLSLKKLYLEQGCVQDLAVLDSHLREASTFIFYLIYPVSSAFVHLHVLLALVWHTLTNCR